MKITVFFCLFFLVGTSKLCAQKPAWADINQRNVLFPKDKYLVGSFQGIHSSEIPDEEKLKNLLEDAKTQIIENISVSISSVSQLMTEQTGQAMNQVFTQQSTAIAKAELAGLKTETAKDRKDLYALAYVDRQGLISFYKSKLKQQQTEILEKLAYASQLLSSGKKEAALDQYYLCRQQWEEAGQAAAMLLGLEKQFSDNRLAELNTKIESGIESITGIAAQDPDGAALVIEEALKKQLKVHPKGIEVAPATYRDCKMGSTFSSMIAQSIESKLVSRGFEVSREAPYLLCGTYWDDTVKLKVLSKLYDVASGKIVASAEATIPRTWFKSNNVAFLPENFQEAALRQKIFTKDEIVDGGLHIDLWTNKGTDNLLFFENETMKLTVKANHECYLRFVYYMADGSKVLLMDDYYISSEMVNKPVEIPETFVCAAPFGAENLQLNAQTVPFEKLLTKTSDGYKYVEDNIADIQIKTRGFKKLETANALKAEKRLTITTLKK